MKIASTFELYGYSHGIVLYETANGINIPVSIIPTKTYTS